MNKELFAEDFTKLTSDECYPELTGMASFYNDCLVDALLSDEENLESCVRTLEQSVESAINPICNLKGLYRSGVTLGMIYGMCIVSSDLLRAKQEERNIEKFDDSFGIGEVMKCLYFSNKSGMFKNDIINDVCSNRPEWVVKKISRAMDCNAIRMLHADKNHNNPYYILTKAGRRCCSKWEKQKAW